VQRALLPLLLLLAAAARADERDEAILKQRGLLPAPTHLSAFLKTLYADDAGRAAAQLYTRQLGDPDASLRAEALRRLADLGTGALAELHDAAESPDPEVRRVARALVDSALTGVDKELLLAVLRTIADRRLGGVAPDLLRVLPVCAELYVLPEAQAALVASARAEDIPLLREAVAGTEREARRAAILALGAVLEEPALVELAPLLSDPDEEARVVAAWALANRGDRTALPAFAALLDAREERVRRRAVAALRHVSGETFGYASYAEAAKRAEGTAAWRRWVEEHGADATWSRPLPPPPTLVGRTLISLYQENRVLEVDAEGKVIWEMRGVPNPWAVQGFPDGHRLVALFASSTIVEFDAEGREIWRQQIPDGHPGSVRRLENGNVLIATQGPDAVLELTPEGTLAREIRIPGRPSDAQLLRNGHLLVCLGQQRKVVELDRRGEIVWTLEGLKSPYSAERLPNGNTLVADLGTRRVQEYDRAGRVVWELVNLKQCYDAQRLENGATLIADRDGVREISARGAEHWLYQGNTFVRAYRY